MKKLSVGLMLFAGLAFGAAKYSDKYLLSTDTTFRNEVEQSLLSACVSIVNEATSTSFHRERATYATLILNNPSSYSQLFVQSVVNDASVIADATANGTVLLTSGNVATQAALVTDAHIDNAISGQFNAFAGITH